MDKITCEHCGGIIKDFHGAYHRKGHHWCSYTCFKEDSGYDNSRVPPINQRKKVNIKKIKLNEYGKRLVKWLYSDPERAYRLDNEGSANW